jgi:hypothetical protein
MWIQSKTENIVASENDIDRVGYTGITFMGFRHLITRNLVTRALWTLNDGGGIYAYGNYSQGTSLTWNIVSNSRGNLEGVSPTSSRLDVCLYFDDWCNAAYVAYNTFYGCFRSILVHDSRDMIIENNLFFNSSTVQVWIFEQNQNSGTYLMTKNNTIRNNVLYNGQKGQELVREDTDYDRTDLFAQYENNLLCSPYESGPYGGFGAQMDPITRQQNTRFCSRKGSQSHLHSVRLKRFLMLRLLQKTYLPSRPFCLRQVLSTVTGALRAIRMAGLREIPHKTTLLRL